MKRTCMAGVLVALAAVGCRNLSYVREMAGCTPQVDGKRFSYADEMLNTQFDPKTYVEAPLAAFRTASHTWEGKRVRLRVLFAGMHDQTVSFRTRFSGGTHRAMGGWAVSARLWVPAEREDAFPCLYVPIGSPSEDVLLGLARFEEIEVLGLVEGHFGGYPCVEVEEIHPIASIRYNESSIASLQAGDEAFSTGRWKESQDAYRAATAVRMPHVGLAAAYEGWGHAAARQGLWAEAAEAYAKAIGHHDGDLGSQWGAANANMMLEEWSKAAARWEDCRALLGDEALARVEVAQVPGQLEAADRARGGLSRFATLNLATARAMAGRGGAAWPLLDELLASNPDDVEALNNYADGLLRAGKGADKALSLSRRAMELSGGDVTQILHTHGWACLASGNGADAVTSLAKAYGKAPGDAEIAFHYAQALLRTGSVTFARAAFERVAAGKSPYASEAAGEIRRIDEEERRLLEEKGGSRKPEPEPGEKDRK